MGLTASPMTLDPLLRDLLELPGISGYEDRVRAYVLDRIGERAESVVDAMGNLSLTLGTAGPRLHLVAHMDEIGLVVSGIDPDGLVRFEKVGTIDDRLLAGRHVTIHTPGGARSGVIGAIPPHHGGSAGGGPATLAIDVGADSADEARAFGIEVLQQATFIKTPRIMNGTRLNCRSIDDRVGCALLMWTFEYASARTLDARITFTWSVQEEVGLRGAQALTHTAADHDVVIPIDACATTDGPNHPRRLACFPLGAGPVLRMVDHGSMGSHRLAAWLTDLATRHAVPLQRGVTGGETDGVPLQLTGAHMVPLTIAMRYVHSLAETADLRDIDHARRLLEHVVDEAGRAPTAPR